MSVTEIKATNSSSGSFVCSRCNSPLPPNATFCSTCGERVDKHSSAKLIAVSPDIADHYRITSLVRRHSCIRHFLATDTTHHRPVFIRDIDISKVDDELHTKAIDIVQQEYDLLRRQHLPDVLPVIDLHYSQDHLFVIQSWPFSSESDTRTQQAQTLHDLLQSGIGLPDEETAITWTYRLCNAVQHLHSHQIVIGNLDPHTIAVSKSDYSGRPALMISWLPSELRKLLPDAIAINTTASFSAPETQEGIVDEHSDIYSLGAILYLLLTGTAPTSTLEETGWQVRSPRELNTKISSGVEAVVMRALAHDSNKRYATADGFAEALHRLNRFMRSGHKPARKTTRKLPIPTQRELAPEPVHDNDEDKTIIIRPRQMAQVRQYLEQIETLSPKSHKKQEVRSEQSGVTAQKEQPGKALIPTSPNPKERPIEEQSTVTISKKEVLDGIAKARSKYDKKRKATKDDSAHQQAIVPSPVEQTRPEARRGSDREDRTDGQQLLKLSSAQRFLQRVTGALPALASLTALIALPGRLLSPSTTLKSLAPTAPAQTQERALLRMLQHILLGEQQHSTTAVALIETPLRVQPNQSYHLRISLMGRNEPGLPPGAPPEMELSGLSALAHGDRVHIEVRTSLIHNYAYILQQADVEIPQAGYAAEITIPLQAIPDGPGGRRERLHICIMDEVRQPLYEKPFAVDLFISPLVQAGREGHNVLTIPL
jgi:serine/threonine protein kinase